MIYEGHVAEAALFANTGLYDMDGRGSYPANDRGSIEITHRAADMLKNLKELILTRNHISILPDAISDLENLQDFDISENNEFNHLPQNIGKLKSLESLTIDDCSVNELPNSFSELDSLKFLYLKNCKFTVLPKQLNKLKSLSDLSMRNNDLQGVLDFNGFEKLTNLDLSECRLKKIPKGIFRLINLESLSLGDNDIRIIPAELIQLNDLQHLDFSDNKNLKINLEFANKLKQNCTKLQTIELIGVTVDEKTRIKLSEIWGDKVVFEIGLD